MSGAPYAIGNPRWPADLRRRTFSSRNAATATLWIGLPWPRVQTSTAARRLLIGRPFRSDRLSHTFAAGRIALPVFAASDDVVDSLRPRGRYFCVSVGLAAYSMALLIGLAVAAVLLVVVF